MTSSTLSGRMAEEAKRVRRPGNVEARVATAPDSAGRVLVTSRALTGTSRRLGPFAAGHFHRHEGETVVGVAVGERVFLGLDESGNPACIVGWEG